MYGFSFEEKTEAALRNYSYLLDKINKDKIIQEISKITDVDEHLKNKLFKEFDISKYINEGRGE